MTRQELRRRLGVATIAGTAITIALGAGVLSARQQTLKTPIPTATVGTQKVDEDYTKRIIDNTPDKRILTELVDHMPLPNDPNVPSPLKFLGYVPSENNQLT